MPTKNPHILDTSLEHFINLAKKYNITTSGSKKHIAERLSSMRGEYLTKTEKKIIMPYLSNNKNKSILLKKSSRKKLPKQQSKKTSRRTSRRTG